VSASTKTRSKNSSSGVTRASSRSVAVSRWERPEATPPVDSSATASGLQAEHQLVDVAPAPVLARLDGADQRMAGLVEVRRCMPVR